DLDFGAIHFVQAWMVGDEESFRAGENGRRPFCGNEQSCFPAARRPSQNMKLVAAIFAGILLLVAVAALPSAPQQVPSPKDVVAPTIYVSLDPVGRGSQFQIAAVLKIRPGFHINAREKSEDYLIATDLRAEAPAGFQLGDVSYPKGALHSFTFSKKPLNVYEDTTTLLLPVTVLPTAPLGAQHIPLKLRY